MCLYILHNSLICIKENNNFLVPIVICTHYITKETGLSSKVLSWLRRNESEQIIENVEEWLKVKIKFYFKIKWIIWPSEIKYQPFPPIYWVLYSETDKFLIRWCASCSVVLPLMVIIFRRHIDMAEINMDLYTQVRIKH